MFVEERRERILQKIYKEKTVSVQQLAEVLQTSVHTIRNDLTYLEEQNHLTRTHGGAVLNERSRLNVMKTSVRYDQADQYQHAIAKRAAGLIKPGMTVYIGGSVTHYLMLQYIKQDMKCTIVTNSLQVALDLSTNESVECYIIGGHVPYSSNTVGSMAVKLMEQFHVDLAFINNGFHLEQGMTTSNPEVAAFQSAVIQNAKKIVGLGNHYKVDIVTFASIASLQVVDLLILDEKVSEEIRDGLEQAKVDYVVATGDELA
ncbi:DeoR/GlpR family transcriptional regulator of sugar metabolism [Alkalihalobacillus xiaoxiensis]|uniref:DeoR/GlpR family transcriptional regulator of sugar metabolism n=1 Tax=Shouchella xiaoxiensis TaxID=766895 RepID=A0ABS2SP68_9BACI|nr:DeoR/GlpR family DNA-binding transcription regulator [Shouchella xiaoxiensis]MBM7837318.1 DeoR/GlpR family transcriptional regulator of sugar metabolism [Shouchella xiaoxiensis]